MLAERMLREHGPVAIDDRFVRDLRTAGKKSRDWTARRDELIRLAHLEGAGVREIARAVGMSHPGVKRIIERSPAEQAVRELVEAHEEVGEDPASEPQDGSTTV